ncbi:hypothetical protein P171DRAFT_179596 [Karstenula rhodostoma CBS 690.94]|uniref:Uncharacterized protein n=1 Tax=Karstenula rhodostoma CBS 690.94 TaxID=1392251 RepID=A0A9P4P5E1_9PLEO|nr:hypothetical protein P171DRAFT_179596 [Karstenula rhodostoma CBS 690.94]
MYTLYASKASQTHSTERHPTTSKPAEATTCSGADNDNNQGTAYLGRPHRCSRLPHGAFENMDSADQVDVHVVVKQQTIPISIAQSRYISNAQFSHILSRWKPANVTPALLQAGIQATLDPRRGKHSSNTGYSRIHQRDLSAKRRRIWTTASAALAALLSTSSSTHSSTVA